LAWRAADAWSIFFGGVNFALVVFMSSPAIKILIETESIFFYIKDKFAPPGSSAFTDKGCRREEGRMILKKETRYLIFIFRSRRTYIRTKNIFLF
jgi:hypothetical protein